MFASRGKKYRVTARDTKAHENYRQNQLKKTKQNTFEYKDATQAKYYPGNTQIQKPTEQHQLHPLAEAVHRHSNRNFPPGSAYRVWSTKTATALKKKTTKTTAKRPLVYEKHKVDRELGMPLSAALLQESSTTSDSFLSQIHPFHANGVLTLIA